MSAHNLFDFRSDTVTQPDEAMRAAMATAAVGDDVYGDDETAASLEERVADMLGKQAGLFVSSGTQSNLIAILSHAARGEEFLSGQTYHSVFYEAGGAAVLGGVVPCPLPVDAAGRLNAADIEAAIKPDDSHFPVTRLLCLENTVNGRVQTAAHLADLCAVARHHHLRCHLDGARLMNAVVASQWLARSASGSSSTPMSMRLSGGGDCTERSPWRSLRPHTSPSSRPTVRTCVMPSCCRPGTLLAACTDPRKSLSRTFVMFCG